MKRFEQRGQGGFTLIELLVVIAILAILAGVVVFAVGSSTKNAKVSACKTEKAAAITAIAAVKAANEVDSNTENPGSYLDTNAGTPKYWTWTGASAGNWAATTVSGAPTGSGTCTF